MKPKQTKKENNILISLYRLFNIKNNPEDNLKTIKKNLFLLILYLLNVGGIPVITFSIILFISLDKYFFAFYYFILYTPIFSAFIFRKKISYEAKIILILISGYLIGASDIYIYGLSGLSVSIFLSIFVLNSLFLDLRKSLISILIIGLTMVIFGFLFTENRLEIQVDLYAISADKYGWLSVTFIMVFLGSLIIASFSFIQAKMKEKILFSEDLAIKLEKDIVERKKTELKLKEREQELKELNRTKDKFFSIIAHDLKGPFNAMLGFSTMLSDSIDEFTEDQKEIVELMHLSIENAYKLTDNLLLWASSQRGNIYFDSEKLNLYLLSDEIMTFLGQLAKNKSIVLENKLAKNTWIKADKNMVSVIIRNLVSNAIKFTNRGGKISINAKEITKENGNKSVKIIVQDSGVGISEEVQSKLFKISKNSSTEGTENESGTGLGLILCKEFVEKHGGKIWVESKKGKGSEFIFTLPYL